MHWGVCCLGGLILLAADACGRSPLDANQGEADAGRDARTAIGRDLGIARDLGESGALWDAAFGDADANPVDAFGSDGRDAGLAPGATILLSAFGVYADCMYQNPVPPDPVIASWTVTITGAAEQTAATLEDATLTIVSTAGDAPTSLTQHLVVTPSTISLSDGRGSSTQMKIGADSVPASVCFELCKNATWSLDLSFDLGTATAAGTFTCPS